MLLTLTPGPIAVVVIRQGVIGNNRRGLLIASGAACMDVLYALIASFASSAIILSVKDFINHNDWILAIIQILCILSLLIMGIKYLSKRKLLEENETNKRVYIKNPKATSAFIGGIVMSVINIASPTFLPSLIALSGYLQTTSIVNHSSISNLLYSIGFGLGVFLWLSFLLAIIKKYHSKIPITMMSNIYKIAGYSFLIFAMILTFKIIGFDELIGLNNHNISIPSLIQSNK